MSNTFSTPSITVAAAQSVVAAAIDFAIEKGGAAFSVAVCDEAGVLKAFGRMDGAPLVSVQIAQDKAYTAVGFGMPSGGWYDFIKDDGPLALGATDGIDRLVIFGGGFPISIDGQVVGAVGVSGGHYSDDEAVAQAGLAALGG